MEFTIQCLDDKFYVKPIWWGPNWCIVSNDLMFESPKKATNKTAMILEVLLASGIKAKIKKVNYDNYALFPPGWDRRKAWHYEVTFTAPPRTPQLGDSSDFPDFDDLTWCWNITFPTSIIWDCFHKKIDSRVQQFLFPITFENMVRKVRNQLKRQCDMRNLTLQEAKENFGEVIKLRRLG